MERAWIEAVAECIEALRTADLGLSMPQIQQLVHSFGFSTSQRRAASSISAAAGSLSPRSSATGRRKPQRLQAV